MQHISYLSNPFRQFEYPDQIGLCLKQHFAVEDPSRKSEKSDAQQITALDRWMLS